MNKNEIINKGDHNILVFSLLLKFKPTIQDCEALACLKELNDYFKTIKRTALDNYESKNNYITLNDIIDELKREIYPKFDTKDLILIDRLTNKEIATLIACPLRISYNDYLKEITKNFSVVEKNLLEENENDHSLQLFIIKKLLKENVDETYLTLIYVYLRDKYENHR